MAAPLKILTWNIWMMPPLALQSPKNQARAAAIAQELLAHDFDIVCLEKAFDPGARAVLEQQLGARYPHRYGPINNPTRLSLKINGGVWVLSRSPLTPVHTIEFRYSKGIESYSRKGAILLHGTWEGHAFQLIATHLQGESGLVPQNQPVRDQQISQIADELITPHVDPRVPLFLCGDFNTARRDGKEPLADAPSYTRMLALFQASNGEEQRLTLEDRRAHNDLATRNSGRVAELDYILLRQAGKLVTGQWERVVMRRQGWDGPQGRHDLAYRFAVGASFTFG